MKNIQVIGWVFVVLVCLWCMRDLQRQLEKQRLPPGLWIQFCVTNGTAHIGEVRNTTGLPLEFGGITFNTNTVRRLGRTEL